MRIPVVSVLDPARVFDRAPVLLRPACNFDHVCQHPVGVRAIHAIQPLEEVQISQFVAVNCDEVLTASFRNAIDRETNGLVNGNKKIGQHERNETSVNERGGEDREESGMQNVTGKRGLELSVLALDVLREPDFAIPQLVKLRLDLLFHLFNVRELDERIGLLRAMIGHIHLARTDSQFKRGYLLRSDWRYSSRKSGGYDVEEGQGVKVVVSEGSAPYRRELLDVILVRWPGRYSVHMRGAEDEWTGNTIFLRSCPTAQFCGEP